MFKEIAEGLAAELTTHFNNSTYRYRQYLAFRAHEHPKLDLGVHSAEYNAWVYHRGTIVAQIGLFPADIGYFDLINTDRDLVHLSKRNVYEDPMLVESLAKNVECTLERLYQSGRWRDTPANVHRGTLGGSGGPANGGPK